MMILSCKQTRNNPSACVVNKTAYKEFWEGKKGCEGWPMLMDTLFKYDYFKGCSKNVLNTVMGKPDLFHKDKGGYRFYHYPLDCSNTNELTFHVKDGIIVEISHSVH